VSTSAIFENPIQQTYQMEQRLEKELNPDVAGEIIAYVRIKSTDKYNEIFDSLIKRVNRIDKIYETETESKAQYLDRMQAFLSATNPSDLARELKSVLVFNEIEKEYNHLLNYFSKDMFGKFYLRYQFDKRSFKGLQAGLLSDIAIINAALEDYSYAVTEHINVMKSIKSSAGGKTFFKVTTKIAGSLLAGPLGSIAGGALANAMTNDDSKMSQSYGNVLDAWGLYLNSIDDFLKNLKERYEHILLTLIGGLFLRVSQDISRMHVTIHELALLEYGIEYRMTKSELARHETWMTTTLNGILTKIRKQQYDSALKGANDLFQYINQQPLLKYETYLDEQCYLYTASVYKFAAISTYAWSIRSNKQEFQAVVHNLFKNRPVVIREEDLLKLNVPPQLELAMLAVSQWIDEGAIKEKGIIFPDMLLKNLERYNEAGVIPGEPNNDDLFTFFAVSVSKYICLEFDMSQYEFFVEKVSINIPTLRELIKTYKKMTEKEEDDLTDFMKGMILSRRVGFTLHYLKKPIVWGSSLVLLIGLGGWLVRDHWLPLFEKEPKPAEVTAPIQDITRYVEIVTSGANVRSEPNLNSDVVTAVSGGETFKIITEQADSDNRMWYKVKVREGQIGWMSEKVVKVIDSGK
jgi:hypothetical protein